MERSKIIFLNEDDSELSETIDCLRILFNRLFSLQYNSWFAYDHDEIKLFINPVTQKNIIIQQLLKFPNVMEKTNASITKIMNNPEFTLKEKNEILIYNIQRF